MKKILVQVFILLMCAFPAFSAEEKAADSKITIDGSTTVGPIAKAFAEYFMSKNTQLKITVAESGSGNGSKSLINGTCDIADMSRFMKVEEIKAAMDKGIVPVSHVVAMDGIALIVHPANPVKNLSIEQIAGIYLGKMTNWKELGGPDEKIVVISRDTNSGTYEAFEELALKKEKMTDSVEYVGSNGAVRQRVQSTIGAIGYVGLGFIDKTVKAVSVAEIEPNRLTILAGKYPIARPLFMFTNGYPKLGSDIYQFVTLHLSPKGQEIIESLGYVAVTQYKK
ncbi:MAG: phosphate ABC transporter substrate-binding protein [Candidatus Riflebacteria bacterium]|nr:phosphate ABC transporter substrate-binding protein [Candidatus Riflebacteria bacterium]